MYMRLSILDKLLKPYESIIERMAIYLELEDKNFHLWIAQPQVYTNRFLARVHSPESSGKTTLFRMQINLHRVLREGFDSYNDFIIAHELQHVCQFLNSDLSVVKADCQTPYIWKGKHFPHPTGYQDYIKQPWEVEANQVAYQLTGKNYTRSR